MVLNYFYSLRFKKLNKKSNDTNYKCLLNLLFGFYLRIF